MLEIAVRVLDDVIFQVAPDSFHVGLADCMEIGAAQEVLQEHPGCHGLVGAETIPLEYAEELVASLEHGLAALARDPEKRKAGGLKTSGNREVVVENPFSIQEKGFAHVLPPGKMGVRFRNRSSDKLGYRGVDCPDTGEVVVEGLRSDVERFCQTVQAELTLGKPCCCPDDDFSVELFGSAALGPIIHHARFSPH